jgi:hypothetical protein
MKVVSPHALAHFNQVDAFFDTGLLREQASDAAT